LGLTLFALVAVYTGIWLAFYAIPLTAIMVRGLVEMLLHLGDVFRGLWQAILDFPRNALMVPFMVFGVMTFAFSATLFVLMPLAVPFLVLRGWWQAVRLYITRFGKARAAVFTGAVTAACAFLFLFLNQQPQSAALALLESTPATPAQAQQLAAQENTIRAGLLNAYLAPQRYISSLGEVQHIRDMYHAAFKANAKDFVGVERAYEVIASPLLYKPTGESIEYADWGNGAVNRESRQAAQLYEDYFDETIFDGERETVLTALGSTWDVSGALQAVQDAADREVHLNKQELSFVERGDIADFELHEEYQNESGQRQEVVYYVTLPESAVITGVWLGNSEDRQERFVYRVAPRGAAQQVYKEQVRRVIDPALVEQIGPRQYRVRVFPIEPKTLGYDYGDFGSRTAFVRQGPPVHLWLTWQVMAKDNAWALPYLAEKRNVYWDAKTTRTLNGQPFNASNDAWLAPSVPALSAITPQTHRFDFPNGHTVLAQPLAAVSLPALPADIRLAVVLDRSRSMAPLANEVQDALAQFKAVADRGATVDVYLTTSKFRGEPAARAPLAALNPDSLTYIGGQNPAALVRQFGQLRASSAYDAVFVLTDGTGYALGSNDSKPAPVDAALWFIHLGGQFPLGYDDGTLEQIQASGGGVAGTLQDALDRFAVSYTSQGSDAVDVNGALVDGYFWQVIPTTDAASAGSGASDPNFAPIAVRRLILANVQRERASLEQLNTLDQLHALAKQYSVVSPYSSMIVLVTSGQQQLLDDLEKQGDRFQREIEEVGQTEQPFDITAVPEPHEYLLMALGVALLVWYARKSRRRVTG
jgi:putative PEP-CTERM system integral membrane protein